MSGLDELAAYITDRQEQRFHDMLSAQDLHGNTKLIQGVEHFQVGLTLLLPRDAGFEELVKGLLHGGLLSWEDEWWVCKEHEITYGVHLKVWCILQKVYNVKPIDIWLEKIS